MSGEEGEDRSPEGAEGPDLEKGEREDGEVRI